MTIALDKLSPAEVEKFIHVQARLWEDEVDQARVRDLRDYYAGNHPTHLTDRQEEFLGPILTECNFPFQHNMVKAVVDTLRERLNVTGITVDGEETEEGSPSAALASLAWSWWEKSHLPSEQITNHRRGLRDGRGYIICGWNEAKGIPKFVVNSAYDGESGITFRRHPDTDEPWLATKYWTAASWDGEKIASVLHKTVYLDHQIWKFQRDMKARQALQWAAAPDPGEPWPLPWVGRDGEPIKLAVIEFANPGGSEIEALVQLQNLLNKSWLDVIATADVASFGLPFVRYDADMGGGPKTTLADDEEGDYALKIRPGAIMEIEAAEVGKIPADDIAAMLQLPLAIITAIAGASRTPQYYLKAIGGSEVPSGEALKQLEAGLVSRAKERQIVFGDAYQRMFDVARRMYNAFGAGGVDVEPELSVVWASAEVRNDVYDAQIALQHQQLGVPQQKLWVDRLGYSPEDAEKFAQVLMEKRAEEIAQVVMAMGQQGQQQGQQGQQGQQQGSQIGG
jgi:hypothetical protein